MIIKYYNGYISIDQLNEMMKTTKMGTSLYDLKETAEKLGFSTSAVKIKLDDFEKENIILPCIVHTIIDKKYKHFIVVYRINYKNKTLIIADPQTKIKKISFIEFQKIYNDIMLILYPIKPIIKNNHVTIKDLIKNILIRYKKDIIHIFIISLILMIFSIISSFYFKIILDNINLSTKYMTLIFIMFLFVNIFKITSNYIRMKIMLFINQKIDIELNMDAYKNVINLPYHYYRNRTTGEIISKLSELDKVRESINKIIIILFFDLPLTIFSTIILFLINKQLLFISLLFLSLYLLTILIPRKYIAEKVDYAYLKKADVISYMQETISGFETVKGLNLEKKALLKYENKYIKYLKTIISIDKFLNFQNYLKEIISVINELVIIYIGVILVKEKEFTLGTLLAFNTIQTFFLTPIRNIIDLDMILIESRKALIKVYEMFKKQERNSLSKIYNGNICINDLSYYLTNKKVLNKINLKINKGEKVVIIGDSGSGKSTLFKIIMGYLETERGHVFFDNIDINDISNFHDCISYISQNEILFTDTLYNNICLYNDNDIKDIEDISYITDIINNNDLGYNMILEENGFNISGGQKQRIVLARTLMKRFEILLIDEGLNQVDTNLERKILRKLFEKYNDKTIIIISHRAENIDLFNRLIQIKNGRIVKDLYKNE